MAITKRYGTSSDTPLASYDWQDLDSGTGYVKYYLANSADESTDYPLILSSAVASDNIVYATALSTIGSFGKDSDVDYDILFNNPRTINGKMFIPFSWGLSTYTSGKSGQAYIIIRARKWDGTTETELDSVQTETLTSAGDGSWTNGETRTTMVEMNFNKEHFKGGETLRITVEIWGNITTATASGVEYGTSPLNRDASIDDTRGIWLNTTRTIFEINVPLKLQL